MRTDMRLTVDEAVVALLDADDEQHRDAVHAWLPSAERNELELALDEASEQYQNRTVNH